MMWGEDGGNLGAEVTVANSACQQRHNMNPREKWRRTRDRLSKAERGCKTGTMSASEI